MPTSLIPNVNALIASANGEFISSTSSLGLNIGQVFLEIQSRLPRGSLLKWLEGNVQGITYNNVMNCMCQARRGLTDGSKTTEAPKQEEPTPSTMGYVYQHAYQNGKSYVGQTRQKPDARWNAQYNEILSFIRAIPKKSIASLLEDLFKDAWERADRKVIDEVAFELLDLAERYHIAKIGTVYPRGYNETAGG